MSEFTLFSSETSLNVLPNEVYAAHILFKNKNRFTDDHWENGECWTLCHEVIIKMIPKIVLLFESTTCQLKAFQFDKWILNGLRPFPALSLILTLSSFNLTEPLSYCRVEGAGWPFYTGPAGPERYKTSWKRLWDYVSCKVTNSHLIDTVGLLLTYKQGHIYISCMCV